MSQYTSQFSSLSSSASSSSYPPLHPQPASGSTVPASASALSSSSPRNFPPSAASSLTLSLDPRARAQYFHQRPPDAPWPDIPLGGRSKGRGGESPHIFPSLISPSNGVHAASLTGDEAAIAQLTPIEVRAEREMERSRRREALRKKAERTRGSGRSGSGTPTDSLPPTPRVTSPHELVHVHPSFHHQIGFGSARARIPSSPFNAAASPSMSTPVSSHARVFSHSSAMSSPSGFASSSSAQRTNEHIRASSTSPSIYRNHDASQYIIPMPDDDDPFYDDLFDRAETSIWRTIRHWSPSTRQRALSWCSGIEMSLGVIGLIVTLGVMNTNFSMPSLHWNSAINSSGAIGLGLLLRSAVLDMNMKRLLMWLVGGTFHLAIVILHAILSFHLDAGIVDANIRAHWNGVDMDMHEKVNEYHEQFELFKGKCLLHLAIIGITSIVTAVLLSFLLCFVLTLRTHMLHEDDITSKSSTDQRQYQQRLKHRQKMARLGDALKERRRLRKLRGRSNSSSLSPGPIFTGLGSQPSNGSWSDQSITEETNIHNSQHQPHTNQQQATNGRESVVIEMSPLIQQQQQTSTNESSTAL